MIFIFCSFWHCFIPSLYPKCILKTLTHVFSLKVEIVHYAVKQRQCREPVLPGWTNTFSTILTMDTWLSQKTCLCPCCRVVFTCARSLCEHEGADGAFWRLRAPKSPVWMAEPEHPAPRGFYRDTSSDTTGGTTWHRKGWRGSGALVTLHRVPLMDFQPNKCQ